MLLCFHISKDAHFTINVSVLQVLHECNNSTFTGVLQNVIASV